MITSPPAIARSRLLPNRHARPSNPWMSPRVRAAAMKHGSQIGDGASLDVDPSELAS